MSTQIALASESYVIPAWTFADRLRKARSVAGLDQRSFAAKLEQKPGAYAQWEAGNNKPRDIVALAKRVELLTRVPASWLLDIEVGPAGIEPTTSTV